MLSKSLLVAVPLSLVLAASSLGCSGTAGTEPAVAAPESATSRAPVAQSSHGFVKVIGDAMADVPLTATQRTSGESLATAAEARHASARTARHDLVLAVAAQVQAGAIDRTALQPRIDALVVSLKAVQPADRAAFEQLHALLTPDQRTAFVDAVEARIGEHAAKRPGMHALHQWAADLNLSDAQKAQIKDALHQRWQARGEADHEHGAAGHEPWTEGKHHGAQLMAAFKQDRFVMDEVAPPRDVAAGARKMTDHILGLAEIALPILTPEQRTVAAQKLRDHAEQGDEGPF